MADIGELSVRVLEAGGAVAHSVKLLDGSPSPQGKREIVILIHGFANDQPTACGSFQKCIDNLAALPVAGNANLPLCLSSTGLETRACGCFQSLVIRRK